jgi:hypothetical protein
MSRRCRPGIRARIVCGVNTGKIVVVVRRYYGELINDATWPKALFPWVVASAGGPLRSFRVENGEECPGALTIVADDRELEPLRDEDEDDSAGEELHHVILRALKTGVANPVAAQVLP